MKREGLKLHILTLGVTLLLAAIFLPGEESTAYFRMFALLWLVGGVIGAILWRLLIERPAPRPRVITHRDGTRARVDGAGKGYERVPSESAAPSVGSARRVLREIGKRL